MGSPLGNKAFIEAICSKRLGEEARLLRNLNGHVSQQSSWLLLSYCGAPRANYILRTLPPTLARMYNEAHDNAIREIFAGIFAYPQDLLANDNIRVKLELPMRFGGMGLQSATRISHFAYWSSWADSLPLLKERFPDFRNHFLGRMSRYASPVPHEGHVNSLQQLHNATIEI